MTTISKERMYEVIRTPHITEKSTRISEHNAIAFKVVLNATKPEIKAAVEALFGVQVKAVNTSVVKGKTRRFRGRVGCLSDFKKAMVTLEEGQFIDVTTGI